MPLNELYQNTWNWLSDRGFTGHEQVDSGVIYVAKVVNN
jgi:hypothetical protein